MSFYECTFIMRQDIPAHDVQRAGDSFMELISNFKVELIKREHWGLRTLEFEVNKNKKGHYVMLCLEAEPAAIRELERHFKISEDVLLYMSLKCDSIDPDPSPMMSAPADIKSVN